jgi:Peptidase family M28
MKLITRKGGVRLGILGAVLAVGLSWAYITMIRMPLKSFRGNLPPLTPAQQALSERLRRDVTVLGKDIGEHNVFVPAKLRQAAEFVESSLARTGHPVQRQSYEVEKEVCHNFEIEIPGKTRREEIIVIGAHYDSVLGSPGANDNGSGVAALLALSAALARIEPVRTLRFVAFVNEEPPNFQTELMGSRVYARRCRERGERVVAMLSLETLGYYSEAKGSQKYPFPFGLLYPSRGNFIAFVGNTGSAALVRTCVGAFRKEAQFPSEGAALPAGIAGVGWSDHWAFWQEGYAAVMVTDTAPFRYPHYHTGDDTPDKLDYERLARVTEGLEKVIRALVNPDG